MKLNCLLFLFTLIIFSCSKDDDKINCITDSSLNNCFLIDRKYMSDIISDGAFGFIGNSNNEYIFYSSDENLLIKIDNNLNEIWRKSYAHLSGSTINIEDILQNSSGEIIILSTKLDQFSEVTKVSSDGELIWKVKFQESNNPQYKTILESLNNEYLLSGSVSGGILAWQPIVTKINDDGNIVWSKVISSQTPDVLQSSSGNIDQYFLLGVNTNSSGREIFYHFMDIEGNYSERTAIGYESGWILESISLSDNGFLTLSSFDQSENEDLSNTDY